MNNEYEIKFLQYDDNDIKTLVSLFFNEGIEVTTECSKENDMGVDLMLLTLLIPPVVTVTIKVLDVLSVWLQNREVTFSLKNKQTKKEITIEAKNGKLPSKKQLESIKTFLE